MINLLIGNVVEKSSNQITLLTGNSVGYQVFIASRIINKLSLKSDIKLFIYTHVREDTISLFGFTTLQQKQIFQLLISVSGIGPKIALAILNAAPSQKIIKAVQNADVSFFTSIPGIGKKSAQRIIIDLKSKLGQQKELDLKDAKTYPNIQAALKSLGFSQKESLEAIANVKSKDKLTDQEIIKQSLKLLK